MDWTQITIDILSFLKNIGGSWGMAIILLTIIVKTVLLPLSISQQRSMKKMQLLSPKLKQLQTKYKHDPQKLQIKMMEFYKENKFNPLGGCLPLIAQMPVLILLYATLVSIPFLQIAGSSSFLFVNRLDGTIQTHAGKSSDHIFSVKDNDKFIPAPGHIEIKTTKGTFEAAIPDYHNAIIVIPPKITPGKPVTLAIQTKSFTFPPEIKSTQQVKSAVIPVINDATKEIENIKFSINVKHNAFIAKVDTIPGTNKFNMDVLVLLVLFAITMYLSQKVLTTNNAAMDPEQKAMQESMSKMMPIMILAMFVIVPIPAGVLLYMVVSNVITFGQTYAINKYIEHEDDKKTINTTDASSQTIEVIPDEDDEDNKSPVKNYIPKRNKKKKRK